MKKLGVSLVLFVTALSLAFATEPSVSGSFSAHYSFPGRKEKAFKSQKAGIGEFRLKVNIPVGDYVKFVMNLRDDKNANNYFSIKDMYASADISGALGIDPVSIDLKVGRFAQEMTNNNSFTNKDRSYFVRGGTKATGKSEAKNSSKTKLTVGKTEGEFPVATAKGGTADVGLDIGIMDYATLLTYASFDDDQFQYRLGLKLGDVLEGLNFVVSYGGNNLNTDAYIKSDLGYELKLGDDISITVPLNVRYVIKTGDKPKRFQGASYKNKADVPAGATAEKRAELEKEADRLNSLPIDPMSAYKSGTFLWAAGLKVSAFGFKFNAGISSQKYASAPGYLDFDLEYTLSKIGLTAYVRPHLSLIEKDDVLEFIDFGLSYALDALTGTTFHLGYVLDTGENKRHKGGQQEIDASPGAAGSVPKLKGGGLYVVAKIKY